MNHFKKQKNRLEKLRGIFFQLGLIIAGGLTLLAFEWTSSIEVTKIGGTVIEEIEYDYDPLEEVEILKEKVKEEKIEPPKPNLDKFEIVPDKTKIEEPKEDTKPKKEPIFKKDDWKPLVEKIEEDAPMPMPEKMPEFEGGIDGLFTYLGKNLKYPKLDKEIGRQGTVYLQFIVDKKGEIKDVKILRGVSETIDKEAVRVVKAMPHWTPGKQSGRPVSVIYNLPITFKLKG